MADLESLADIIKREWPHMQQQHQKYKRERREQTFACMIAALLASGDADIDSIPGDVEEYFFLLDHDGGKRWGQVKRAYGTLAGIQPAPTHRPAHVRKKGR